MALITDVTTTWSAPVVLVNDEFWQVRKGNVFLTSSDSPTADDGISILEGQGLYIRAGRSVRYRKKAPTEVMISHEAV